MDSGWARAAHAPSLAEDMAIPSSSGAPLSVGTRVFHNRFGEGVVRAVEGTEDDARAQVAFTRHGTKWLALSVAKLTVVE
ncbi:MAG: hypothetical protein EPN34_04160, partial [Burkholderiaceae bacterium]